MLKTSEKTGERHKLVRPYGPYRVVSITTNNASLCRVDKPQEEPILVALSRFRRCPEEIKDEFWPPDKDSYRPKRGRSRKNRTSLNPSDTEDVNSEHTDTPESSLPVGSDPPRDVLLVGSQTLPRSGLGDCDITS